MTVNDPGQFVGLTFLAVATGTLVWSKVAYWARRGAKEISGDD